MFGLDDRIASLSDGTSVWVVLLVAVLLGLRHATDPDHLAAVTSLVASEKGRAVRRAASLGLLWGLGHAATLFAFGLPIILLDRYLPERVQQVAEVLIALVIIALAVRLIHRWRKGHFHSHEHEHGGIRHRHLHVHADERTRGHGHRHEARTRLGSFGIGLVHGMGGSAGVGVLVLATVDSTATAVGALALLALFTAVSMTVLSTGFGATLASRPARGAFNRLAPVLGVAGLAFGVWYGLGALELAPYVF